MRRDDLSYEKVPGFRENPLFLDYLSGKEGLREFLPPLLRGDGEIRERVKRLRTLDFPRAALAERLREVHREMGAGEATLAGIEDLARGAMVVVTGQQPGLLGGPAYTTFKALTACLLARQVEARGFGRTVPIFWCASEDHDLAEVNRLDLLDGEEPERLSLEVEDREAPLCDYEIDSEGPPFLERVKGALGRTEFTDALMERVASWMRGGFAGWFSRQMLDLFGDQGLILVEPRWIRDLQTPFLEREIREPARTGEAIRRAGGLLEAAGYEPLLGGDEGPGLFLIRDGVRQRIRLRDGNLVLKGGLRLAAEDLLRDLRADPERFSPGVAVRPVVQDGLFPTLAMVAGPSEVGYLAQLGEVYRNHGVEPPPILPRLSITLVEGKVERALHHLSLSKEQAFQLGDDMGKVLQAFATETDAFTGARSRVEEALVGLEESLPAEVRRTFPRTERRIRRELDRLQGKVEEAERRRQGLGRERLQRVRNAVSPSGKLQERVWGIIPFLNRYGPDLISKIPGSVDPFSLNHQWLYLAPDGKGTGKGKEDSPPAEGGERG